MLRVIFLILIMLPFGSGELSGQGRNLRGRSGVIEDLLFRYDFSNGSAGWLAGFSDYSLANGNMHFLAEPKPLPEELGAGNRLGFLLRSMNRSDDMFMFLKKALHVTDGLKPNQRYALSLEIVLASNAQIGCIGAGGAPGEGVYLKAGATASEPVSILGPGQHLELNIDKGYQSLGGADAGVVGDITNGEPCDATNNRYARIRRVSDHDRPVSTDDRGQLWVIVGTDSAFEGLTALYYESITVRLKEMN